MTFLRVEAWLVEKGRFALHSKEKLWSFSFYHTVQLLLFLLLVRVD